MSQQVNLFNPLFSRQKEPFSALAMVQWLGIILFGVILFYVYAQYQVTTLGKQAAATAQRLNFEQTRLVSATAEFAPKTKSKALEDEIIQLEAQTKNRMRVLEVLQGGELGNATGFSGYLRAFSHQAIEGLWLTGFSIHGAGNQMAITGRAMNPELVPTYIKRLNQEQVMLGRSFAAMEIGLPEAKPVAAADKNSHVITPRFVEFRLTSMAREEAK